MTDAKPLSKDEIARLFSENAMVMFRAIIAEKGFLLPADARFLIAGCERLIATIEARDAEIAKLRGVCMKWLRRQELIASTEIGDNCDGVFTKAMAGVEADEDMEKELREAVAATEPK